MIDATSLVRSVRILKPIVYKLVADEGDATWTVRFKAAHVAVYQPKDPENEEFIFPYPEDEEHPLSYLKCTLTVRNGRGTVHNLSWSDKSERAARAREA